MRQTTETWPGMGDRIRQRVRELGYQRVEDFTQDKRYSLGLFYKWMGEKVYPSKANILRLARDLNVTLRWLMWGTATHIEGVPVDLLATPPADLQPVTFEEKRAFMNTALAPPKIKKGKGKRGARSEYYVKSAHRHLVSWLNGWGVTILHPQVACAT